MTQQSSVDNLIATLSGSWSQTDRVLRLFTPLDKQGAQPTLLAEVLRGAEGFELHDEGLTDTYGFRFEVTALSTDANLELKQLIGQPVLLQLQTSLSRTDLRPFHGYVTQFEHVGANGGLARYRLTIEPWTAFLRYRRDSTVYQDMTVIEILESIFSDYRQQGKLNPVWRVDLADVSVYPKRSLTTQYQETDLAFIERLMAEEGLFGWFEHAGDTNNADLGTHTLVIADHNDAFKPNEQAQVSYTQPGAVMKVDSIDRWRSERRWQTNAIELVSWNYRDNNVRPVAAHGAAHNSSDATALISQDVPGVYAYETRAQGQRIATNQLQAIEAANKRFTAAGTVRTLRPGTVFTLNGHADHDQEASEEGRTFAILRVLHLAHNNINADLHAAVMQRLGASPISTATGTMEEADLTAKDGKPDAQATDRTVYRNRINVIRKSIPYRPSQRDGHGTLIHPKPTVHGQQSAIVVGPAEAVIHTDRDHRIKVQFHWQRGVQSHSRLAHPSTDGHTGAPADDSAGTWVRVATPLAPVAGANWGSQALPRVGQEVLIDYLEGDIDRPVVIGSLYNGQGQDNAQNNQVAQGTGSATGNAAAWFPGEQEAHSHAAVLSGIKTQAMGASQQGTGAYNQLVFDDSPGQSRTVLQQHAGPHQGTAELNLGHLRHQTDNQRLPTVGYGIELKTPHSAALRAGQGMLISTDARTNATGSQLDSKEAQTQIEQSHALQKTLADTAQKHNAKLKDDPAADKLPAIDQHQHSLDVVMQTASGAGSNQNNTGNTNQVTAYSEPHLQLSSPAGITAMSPASAILVAGNTSSITANQDINLASQKNSSHAVKNGISLFTYGKASDSSKPNQETGIKLHAASGTVSSQSQSDETKITADKLITVASITRQINIAAKQHVQLTAQGAYLKLEGGNIEIHGPGVMAFKASMKELTGPQSASSNVDLPKPGPLADCEYKV